MKVMFACGGTGGHIYPAIAVAEALKKKKRGIRIVFAGNEKGMEKEIVRGRGFRFVGIDARPLIRKPDIRNISNGFVNIKTFFKTRKMVELEAPDCVAGTGGFVSFPVVYSAVSLGIRSMIHEPNMHPGLANRILAPKVSCVTLGFEETAKYFKRARTIVTGNPFRESLLKEKKSRAYKEYSLSPQKKTVLIMPGSRAARNINRVVLEALAGIEKKLGNVQLLWMCGSSEYENILAGVKQHGRVKVKLMKFIKNAGTAYAIADAAVLRAGASTLTEIAALSVPSLLVPYPFATAGHQEKNAGVLEKEKAAVVIKDPELTADSLVKALKKILSPGVNGEMRRRVNRFYRSSGAGNIAEIITGEKCE